MKKDQELSEDELKRANKEFPMFHSRHEGLGVISEELYEVEEELELIEVHADTLKASIFHDRDSNHVCEEASKLKAEAIRSAAELIQVAAMCQKMIDSEVAAPVITRKLQRWCNNRMIFKSQPDFGKYKE